LFVPGSRAPAILIFARDLRPPLRSAAAQRIATAGRPTLR
jgi:hypothetical protein